VSEPAWKVANRAHWDELVAVHLGPRGYDLTSLRERRGRLNAIEEAELWPVEGQYILHLQCHFGADTLTFAQRGATVVGLDFLPSAILAAGRLADELGLAARARFVQADLYDAATAIPEPAAFDMVFVSWGAIGWLPDIRRWAEIVAHLLKPGGSLYLAEAHPAALVFDDAASQPNGRPGFFAPYFSREPVVSDGAQDGNSAECDDAYVDTPACRHYLEPVGGGPDLGLVSRARRRDVAYVQDFGAGCRRAVALAGSTLAAACVFAAGDPALAPAALEFQKDEPSRRSAVILVADSAGYRPYRKERVGPAGRRASRGGARPITFNANKGSAHDLFKIVR
jgi:SAM-dependent methyltransferase